MESSLRHPTAPTKYQPTCSVDVVLAAVGRAALWAASSQAPGPVASTVPMPDRKSGTPAAVLMPAHEGKMGSRAGEWDKCRLQLQQKKIQTIPMSNQGYQTTTCTTPSPQSSAAPRPTTCQRRNLSGCPCDGEWDGMGMGEPGHAEQSRRGGKRVCNPPLAVSSCQGKPTGTTPAPVNAMKWRASRIHPTRVATFASKTSGHWLDTQDRGDVGAVAGRWERIGIK
jgi:hypothetical protein